jgi:serine/threonine protein kinase
MLQFTELQLGEKIGEGSFAKVWEGKWGDYRVAIKKLKNPNITEKFFLREVANLQYVHSFCFRHFSHIIVKRKSHHPNVVLFMGACIQPPCIVTEVSKQRRKG